MSNKYPLGRSRLSSKRLHIVSLASRLLHFPKCSSTRATPRTKAGEAVSNNPTKGFGWRASSKWNMKAGILLHTQNPLTSQFQVPFQVCAHWLVYMRNYSSYISFYDSLDAKPGQEPRDVGLPRQPLRQAADMRLPRHHR